MKQLKPSPTYPLLIPEIEEWPIFKLHEQRAEFIEELVTFTLNRFVSKNDEKELRRIIERSAYLEKIRIKEDPWKVDPPDEKTFWKKISADVVKAEQKGDLEELLKKIIRRYSEEIVGTFKKKTFLFARKFLTTFFKQLLNTASGGGFFRFWGTKHELYERLKVYGPLEDIRSLAKKGTLVVLPTHFSNLDSTMVGYAMDAVLGLPSFSYGAGLNLFNTGAVAYYMNRLGAYRLDRRKKNPIYLETLKAMSNLSIQKGTNSLFFPGGTRSRSGSLEKKLKLGLLGTTVEAQRSLYQAGSTNKIIVVPLIIGYNFVLEARYMIDNYLKRTGKERYHRIKDQSFSIRKIAQFAWQFFAASSDITLSFGEPMDVLGNRLDADGNSWDQFGNQLELKEYFITQDEVIPDLQREMEYTRMLADKIVERYHKESIILTSHLVAFTAFKIFRLQNKDLDLFAMLRLPLEDFSISLDLFVKILGIFKQSLFELEKLDRLKLPMEMEMSSEEIVRDGIKKLGTYHAVKPLKVDKKGRVFSQNFNLLYYYHNRIDSYDLEKLNEAWKDMVVAEQLDEA